MARSPSRRRAPTRRKPVFVLPGLPEDDASERDAMFATLRWETEGGRILPDAAEQERRLEILAEEAHARLDAVEKMLAWFYENFEDPALRTPRDPQSQAFLYVWGGPFDAGEMLARYYRWEYRPEWVRSAITQVQRQGVVEWAPTPEGEYYLPLVPRNAGLSRWQLTRRARDRLAALEEASSTLIALGHNHPPEEFGVPPYSEDDRQGILETAEETRAELDKPAPDPIRLVAFAQAYARWYAKFSPWFLKKADLAVDEAIKEGVKNGVRLVTFTAALGLLKETIVDLLQIARSLLGI